MVSIIAIVEGNGEVQAVPVLLRRMVQELAPARDPVILKPIRVQRTGFVKAGVLERYVGLAARRVGAGGSILILLDANGDCPARLGPALLARARSERPDRRIEAVVAKCEYETWFLTSVESIAGGRTFARDLVAPPDPESIRGAKEWLSQRRHTPYRPTADQTALTARFDMALARRRSPSFDKMWRAVGALLQQAASNRMWPRWPVAGARWRQLALARPSRNSRRGCDEVDTTA